MADLLYFSITFYEFFYTILAGEDPEILKRRGADGRPSCSVNKENFRFQMV